MSATSGGVFHAQRIQIWRQTAAGLAVGQLNPDSLVNNTTSHAYMSDRIISTTLPQPTYESWKERGGGVIRGQADMGYSDLGTFEVTMSDVDGTLTALTAGGNVDTTSITNVTVMSPNLTKISPWQIGMMITASIQSNNPSTLGTNYYFNIIFPKVQVRVRWPGVTQEGGVNPNPVVLQCTPSLGSGFPIGPAFGANQGWEGDKTIVYGLVTVNPLAITCYIQNGSATTYTTAYKPTSSAVTGGTTTNLFTVGGVATAPTSINTSTGVVTLAAAGTAGVIAAAMYQTAFVAV